MTQEEKSKPRRRRWWIGIGITLGVIVIVVLLLPTIASSIIVPGIIKSAVASQVNGQVEVSGTSFSWFGSQNIQSIKIDGKDDATELDVSVKIDRSLFGLIFNSSNLGQVDVDISGKGELLSDGSTSLSSLIRKKSSDDKDKPPSNKSVVPSGFNIDARIRVESLKLAVVGMKRSVVVSDLKANADIKAGGPIDVSFDTKIESDGRSGTLGAKFSLTNGLDKSGRLQLADATLDGSVTARNLRLPTAGEWVQIDTLDLSATSKELGKNVAMAGDASGTFQDSSPISLKAKMDLGSLIGPSGQLMVGPESMSGSVEARSIPSSLLQPFLGQSPITLVRDLGPELNLSLTANVSSTHLIHIELDAARVKAVADLSVDEEKISNGKINIDAKLAKSMLAGIGVESDGDISVVVHGSGLSMNISSSGQPEVASFVGELDLTADGAILVEPKINMRVTNVTAKIATTGLAKGLSVDAGGSLSGAQLKASGSVSNLIANGALEPGNATVTATASVAQLDPVQLEALFGDSIPPGALTDATGGPVSVHLQVSGKPEAFDVKATLMSANVNGSADAKIVENLVQVPGATITATVTEKSVVELIPDSKSFGQLTSPATIKVTGKGLSYNLAADPATEIQDRFSGSIHGEVERMSMQLVNPPETVIVDEVAVDVAIGKDQPIQLSGSAKISTEKEHLGSAVMHYKEGALDADLKIDNVPTVAGIAGINPGPVQVALGPSATMNLKVPPGPGDGGARTVTGTVQSPRAQGDFHAVLDSDVLKSAKVKFSTRLEPGDLEKVLGSNSAVRLVNMVPVSLEIDASQFLVTGGVLDDSRANMSFTAQSMQIAGDEDSSVNIRGINGQGSVRGRDLQATFSAYVLDGSDSGGNGRAQLVTHAKLPQGEQPFQLGDTKLELDSVPTLVFELVGSDGRIAEAALGKIVNSKATIKSVGEGQSSVKAQLTSPYASFDVPGADLKDSIFQVSQEQPVTAHLKVSPELSEQLLSVVHPIFADIVSTNQPFRLSVGPLTLPLEGDQASKLNGYAELDIGEVMLKSTDFGAGILTLLGNAGGKSVPAKFSLLKVTATNGVVEYKDFIAYIGQEKGGSYTQELRFNGKIDLASNPPTVIGISASFPATNLAPIFRELRKVPPSLLGTLRPKVTFYGPLYDKNGKRIPLKKKIDPISFDDGLSPGQVGGIIKGIGDLIRNKN